MFRMIHGRGKLAKRVENRVSDPDFCLIFAPCGYDDPEILRSVSMVPTSDTSPIASGEHTPHFRA
jgi:hypothetical protein